MISPSPLFLPFVIGLALTASVHATPTSEQASLALLLNQLNQMESTLNRAQAQASVTPDERFFFDYPQALADIRTVRAGIEHYLTPSRAQPHTVLPLSGQYRAEDVPQ
ncbi:conjugal transfer protein [Salmonella enterica subsp. enterica]|uniref:Conjugal transfer protein n=1 Tax=Salmonella enterica subsp. enterica serovar Kintambo TaxID=1192730 RepID=A0A5W7RWL1_SALET|nr:conjugal transfer protein [Salmonella enterica subsp. enterica serovar Kintambo]ECE6153295.1 conjugal transfer protein [Salmonella enterica subsp. enterica]ELX7028049.1 conjugal transfer protein [Salmonella enterica]ECJ4522114.1 conjugal transfer protein [Salmonella enterica subsp. enterica]ECQ6566275.1 conjugal transfer protein [Salmonella enterica subsp. enterica serovar Kintambo]